MRCIEPSRSRWLRWAAAFAAASLLAGCNVLSVNQLPPSAPMPAPAPSTTPVPSPAPAPVRSSVAPAPAPSARPAAPSQPLVTSWQQYRQRAAQMIVAANPQATFTGPLPDPLASIPVLQVQLNADGSVRNIEVLRVPKFEPQTVEMAKVAIARAAPFGPVGNLPRPWQFNETFLYNDALKFQLRTLVEGD